MGFRKYIPVIVTALMVVGFQIVLSLTGTTYYLTQITMSAYYALVVIGLCLLMGYAGQVSLGHAGFFAISGYTSAVLTTCNLILYREYSLVKWLDTFGLVKEPQDIYGAKLLSFSPFLCLIVSVALT